MAEIPNLVYALCVMYETMRLYPIVPTTIQKAETDQVICTYRIPKGTAIGPDFIALHRNENYWGSTCNMFDPSRFDARISGDPSWYTVMDGKIKIPVKGSFLPFGDGPRVCLGE